MKQISIIPQSEENHQGKKLLNVPRKYTTGQYSEQPPEQPAHTSRLSLVGKMDVKFFFMFIVAENTRSVNIY